MEMLSLSLDIQPTMPCAALFLNFSLRKWIMAASLKGLIRELCLTLAPDAQTSGCSLSSFCLFMLFYGDDAYVI